MITWGIVEYEYNVHSHTVSEYKPCQTLTRYRTQSSCTQTVPSNIIWKIGHYLAKSGTVGRTYSKLEEGNKSNLFGKDLHWQQTLYNNDSNE